MAKIAEIQELAINAVNNISDSPNDWKKFLDTSSRLYKHSFNDQVLIYAQRPDATACTTLKQWNKHLNRWVIKGSKGIAVFDTSDGNTKLRYLFDLADTQMGRNDPSLPEPKRWSMNPAMHADAVCEELQNDYGTLGETLEEQIIATTRQLSKEYAENDGLSHEEFALATGSALYSIGQRCSLELITGNFDLIAKLDKPRVVDVGTVTSRTSKEILQCVERAVKRRNLEIIRVNERSGNREKNHRSGLQADRGLSDSGRYPIGRESNREIRQNATELPEGTKNERVQSTTALGRTERSSEGEPKEGREDAGGSDPTIPGSKLDTRENGKSVGVGGIYEQPSSHDGRNNTSGSDLRLNISDALLPPNVQRPTNKSQGGGRAYALFPTEKEQIDAIEARQGLVERLWIHENLAENESTQNQLHGISTKEALEVSVNENDQASQNSTDHGDTFQNLVDVLKIKEQCDIAKPPRLDYRIIDDELGGVGAKTRYRSNVDAIKTLKMIEKQGRFATPGEQEVLVRYTGWGAIPQAFDPEKSDWKKEYDELQELLTGDEYRAARSSTLNAHYTKPEIIRSMYEVLERMGFQGGSILEPSMGTGNFFGMLPDTMREKSRLTGVELDLISGRIATQLYQNADVRIGGYEKTPIPDSFYDIAIGNIPFGQYRIPDKKYPSHLLIHDYFFVRTLDTVRPGGVIAFITSKGSLDKADPKVRRYIAQRADLLGAVRLPSNTFSKNAGTEVTTDIIFLQKRHDLRTNDPNWVFTGQTEDGISVNQYYLDHPEMMLGKMVRGMNLYGNETETSCEPIDGLDFSVQLSTAMSRIDGKIAENDRSFDLDEVSSEEAIRTTIPADPSVKNYSYTIRDGEIYYCENGLMCVPDLSEKGKERVKGMIEIRDSLREVMEYQLNDYSDEAIQAKQHELNTLYDNFTKKHGIISSRGNSLAMREDESYYLLCSLEILDEDHQLERKADIFEKRTISKSRPAEHAETSSEALILSISEKANVDMEYMHQLTGFSEEKIVADLKGVIFVDPKRPDYEGRTIYEPADSYLSGNVRRKLAEAREAAETDADKYGVNVIALEQVQPKELMASEIEVRLGATWIDTKYIKQFILETLDPGPAARRVLEVSYAQIDSSWYIEGKKADFENLNVISTFGTRRANAYKIIEDTLNLRDVRVYDINPEKTGGQIVNYEETALAQQKQELIKHKFREWIFKDPVRRNTLVKKYNELYNNIRLREFNGDHLTFPGMTPLIILQKHQKDAIARILYGGNTMLAHEVGAGKTYEMVAAAMESKRLGLCRKSIVVVPNHLTEQMGTEFLRLYPGANILVATKADFETKNRKRFCGKIATGDYDAVIIGHTQFEKIPVSDERQAQFINDQIDEITEGLDQMKVNRTGDRYSVKQMEKLKKSLEAKLEILLTGKKKDDVVTFEQLGVDRMYIDEAHNYKNLALYTKMRNIAGLSQSDAQKSTDMYLKCLYMDELTGGKGIIMATGTPVSNSMTELYTSMRYLQASALKERGLANFDSWAANFGETITAIELAPEGTGYRAKTRFARFYNLPELMKMYAEVADIKTADMLNLPRPKAIYHNVTVQATPIQEDFVQSLSVRAGEVHSRAVKPTEDNMLKITLDGRKVGLDPRLMDEMIPDDKQTKVNECMRNIYEIWGKTQEHKSTQLLFCDFSTPGEERFNVYDDIRNKLTLKGIPKHEIAYIHDANTDAQKKELFAKVRAGKVRILMGSTQKMGAGTNVQDKLAAIHHLDAPWRPGDLTQRDGRGVRQGNENDQVDIYRYVTQNTFDGYLYQMLENKQRFISQIMTSRTPVRSCEDIDDATLSFAEVKALCTGNPLIKEKMTLDMDVRKLKIARANYQSNQYDLEDKVLKFYPTSILEAKERIDSYRQDLDYLGKHTHDDNNEKFSPMTVGAKTYEKKEDAGKALLEMMKGSEERVIDIGQYRGFDMHIYYDVFAQSQMMTLKRPCAFTGHKISLGSDVHGNITRINNGLSGISEKIDSSVANLEHTEKQLENAKEELKKPFAHEEEYQVKIARLSELDTLLNLDNSRNNMPDSWKKEVESLKLIENPKIYCDHKPGTYEGEILHSTNDYVAQMIGCSTILLIDTKRLPEKLTIGQKVKITLPHNGVAEIQHSKSLSKTR